MDLDTLKKGWTQNRVVSEISNRGVYCVHGGCSEVYLEKAFDGTGWRPKVRLPNAKLLGETSLMFLIHPTLEDSYLEHCQKVLGEIFLEAFL